MYDLLGRHLGERLPNTDVRSSNIIWENGLPYRCPMSSNHFFGPFFPGPCFWAVLKRGRHVRMTNRPHSSLLKHVRHLRAADQIANDALAMILL